MIVRFFIAALGSLWLLAGILSFGIATTMPRDPDAPPAPDLDAARWVMFVWASLGLILLGPLGLATAIDKREERRKAAETRKRTL